MKKFLILTLGCVFILPLFAMDKIIVGDFMPDWQNIETLNNPKIQDEGRAVGRLSMPAKRTTCTAFLISEDIIMTNQHCIKKPEDAVGAKIYFDYLEQGEPRVFLCDKFISNNKKLDYALLKCEGSPGLTYGYVKLSQTPPTPNMVVYLVHQNCDYYQNQSCKRSKKVSFGQLTSVEDDRLYHNGDTLPGSSGSPIFSTETHEVIGLHNSGSGEEETNGRRNGRGKINLGIPMSSILAEIRVILPDLP